MMEENDRKGNWRIIEEAELLRRQEIMAGSHWIGKGFLLGGDRVKSGKEEKRNNVWLPWFSQLFIEGEGEGKGAVQIQTGQIIRGPNWDWKNMYF